LVKRAEGETDQPAVFVYESRYIGLDDVVPRTPASVAETARTQAATEMGDIQIAYAAYLRGEKGPWLVPADRIVERLDAKFLRPWSASELERTWRSAGAGSVALETLVEPVVEPVVLAPDERYQFLRITYAGHAERGETRLGKEVTYDTVGRARIGDLVISNINGVNRAVCVIAPGYEDLLISSEFTVLRLRLGAEADPMYLWYVLRTDGVVAEWLSHSSGVGRHRVSWDLIRQQRLPVLNVAEQQRIGDLQRSVLQLEKSIEEKRQAAQAALAPLALDGEVARDRLARAKPPK
jgi:type I restriction enzyme M protein